MHTPITHTSEGGTTLTIDKVPQEEEENNNNNNNSYYSMTCRLRRR